MQTKHYVAVALVVGLAIGIAAWLIVAPRQAVAPGLNATSTGSTTATSTGGVSIVGNGQATITEVTTTVPKAPATPALSISADLSADAKQALQTQYNTLTAQLKSAPTRVDLWLELGTVYKIAGQYDAAIASWTYVAHNGPNSINYVAYGNLGDLYLNFLHDYANAAASYRLALKGNPGSADYQAGLQAAESHL